MAAAEHTQRGRRTRRRSGLTGGRGATLCCSSHRRRKSGNDCRTAPEGAQLVIIMNFGSLLAARPFAEREGRGGCRAPLVY
jgi:hypothetical protein